MSDLALVVANPALEEAARANLPDSGAARKLIRAGRRIVRELGKNA